MDKRKIGEINQRVIELLGLDIQPGTPIIIGQQNIDHMLSQHPEDYKRYGGRIEEIIENPTYVSKNPRQESIEYIKVFEMDGKHVLLAVRVSGKGVYFARTLFVMSEEKVRKYREKNALFLYNENLNE
ncbi:PBECR2 nuclease fold domain-containing protein [Petroclostridium xylanilyticum]|jgi:hypothetical protein|uniref:PBECR3 domain-containing polyvalent protein n=1 Tax=Petroclostridium xylanilyticum TaxID=1792311 RepID=UPI000B9915D2|nr:PBECR2 nuclease fold domain-containing protein [Petroclostridium xylanilyticum]